MAFWERPRRQGKKIAIYQGIFQAATRRTPAISAASTRSQKPGRRVLQAGEAKRVDETPSVDSQTCSR
ncbi:unnamed protein product [Acanthoscelides obtectus]|uniref:Uncharacterized protein n=1 Tax=Acanthoscelides obtectus TaxID=200917 RepID=A0A9P0MJS8_ACAOB|nr:unnamed protein product [Acanthoscelides obtectus]CAK1683664.1 hypothetical protein AOBTE_LOCUS34391 [Acanthoscelides obtectus]